MSSIHYYDVDDNEYTFANTSYFQDLKNEPGWVVLAYGEQWPTIILRPANGVCVTFIAGETTAATVKKSWKQAMLLLIGHYYEHREEATDRLLSKVPNAVDALLWLDRIM